jgi:RHS repeat-associated protein
VGLEYEYDGFGNRTAQNVTQGQGYSQQAQYDPATNWMLGSTTDYDANGNLILLPGMQMKYDALNRMMRVDMAGGTERYSYDPKNLRIWTQSVDGTETFNFYQGTRNLASYTLATDASGNLSFTVAKTNIYFGKRLAQSGGDVVITDSRGSTRAWSAKKGAKTASYLPFGEKIQGADDKKSQFDGYEEDVTTGLKYAEQRYYSSTLGRFMSPDPYEGSAHLASPESWNRYSFVANDPINKTDPHGLNSTGNSNNGGGGGGGGSYGGGGGGGSYGGGNGGSSGNPYAYNQNTLDGIPYNGPIDGESFVQEDEGAEAAQMLNDYDVSVAESLVQTQAQYAASLQADINTEMDNDYVSVLSAPTCSFNSDTGVSACSVLISSAGTPNPGYDEPPVVANIVQTTTPTDFYTQIVSMDGSINMLTDLYTSANASVIFVGTYNYVSGTYTLRFYSNDGSGAPLQLQGTRTQSLSSVTPPTVPTP